MVRIGPGSPLVALSGTFEFVAFTGANGSQACSLRMCFIRFAPVPLNLADMRDIDSTWSPPNTGGLFASLASPKVMLQRNLDLRQSLGSQQAYGAAVIHCSRRGGAPLCCEGARYEQDFTRDQSRPSPAIADHAASAYEALFVSFGQWPKSVADIAALGPGAARARRCLRHRRSGARGRNASGANRICRRNAIRMREC